MSLHIVYGRAGSGKSRFCIDEIAKEIVKIKEQEQRQELTGMSTSVSSNEDTEVAPLILIVPEQYTVQAESMLLSCIPGGSIISAEVLSFRRMAQRVLERTGGNTKKPIDAAGRRIIFHRAIEECKNNLRYFKNAANHKGFLSEIIKLVDELARYNFDAERMAEIQQKLNPESALHEKINEVRIISEKYDEILHEKYIDSHDILDMLALNLPDFAGLNGAKIWIDEFSGFTPQEDKIISQLIQKAERLTVTLCCDELESAPGGQAGDASSIFHGVQSTYRKLLEMADASGTTVEPALRLYGEPLPRFAGSEPLAHLEREYFSYPYNVHEQRLGDERIHIYGGKNIYSEVTSVALNILELCRDGHYRYRDIAVVARDIESYRKVIEVVFEKYDIPMFLDTKKNLLQHPLTRLVMSALEAISENFSYQGMFKYLKSGLLPYPVHIIDALENHVLARNIRGKRWLDDSYWEELDWSGSVGSGAVAHPRPHGPAPAQVRQDLLRPLLNLRSAMKADNTVAGHSEALYRFLMELQMPEIVSDRVEQYKAQQDFVTASLYIQVWNIIMGVLEQLTETLGDEKTTIIKFRDLIGAAFEDYEVGVIPSTLDNVSVGSVERSKNHEIKALFVLGVNDGVFPAVPGDEGILTDMDRAVLKDNGVELAPDTREQAFREQFLVYSVLTAPSQHLYLSYSSKDDRGAGQKPSEIIRNVSRIFPSLKIQSDLLQKEALARPLHSVAKQRASFSTLLDVTNDLVELEQDQEQSVDGAPAEVWSIVYHQICEVPEYRARLEQAGDFYLRNNMLRRAVDVAKVRELFGESIYTSVSRIEEYNQCPFEYFVEYGLKARERKVLKLAMPDIGSFVHEIVEEFSRSMKNTSTSWDRCLNISDSNGVVLGSDGSVAVDVNKIVDDILSQAKSVVFNDSARYGFITKRLTRMVNRAIEAVAFQVSSGDFEPYLFEVKFEEHWGRGWAPTPDPGVQLIMTGQIDRIDLYEQDGTRYYRVVDYKSGSKDFSLSDVYNGLTIQLLTYLGAVVRKDEGSAPAGCLYFKVVDSYKRVDGELAAEKSAEEIKMDRLKSYKMDGLVVDDPDIVAAMDRNVETGSSKVIPVRVNKDGSVKGSAAPQEKIEKLTGHVEQGIVQSVGKIMCGEFAAKPIKSGTFTACSYCLFFPACDFNPDNQSYRFIKKIKDDEIWRRLDDN